MLILITYDVSTVEKPGLRRLRRALRPRGEKIVLSDYDIGFLPVDETGGVLPREHPVVTRVGDVDRSWRDRGIDRDPRGLVQLAPFHEVGIHRIERVLLQLRRLRMPRRTRR